MPKNSRNHRTFPTNDTRMKCNQTMPDSTQDTKQNKAKQPTSFPQQGDNNPRKYPLKATKHNEQDTLRLFK